MDEKDDGNSENRMDEKNKITTAQIKKIWATARETGMQEEDLRFFIYDFLGKPPSLIPCGQPGHIHQIKGLTKKEAIKLIDKLELKAGRIPKKGRYRRRIAPNMTELITPYQVQKISEIEIHLGWNINPVRLENLNKKVLGDVAYPRTTKEAGKVIEALKAIHERSERG